MRRPVLHTHPKPSAGHLLLAIARAQAITYPILHSLPKPIADRLLLAIAWAHAMTYPILHAFPKPIAGRLLGAIVKHDILDCSKVVLDRTLPGFVDPM